MVGIMQRMGHALKTYNLESGLLFPAIAQFDSLLQTFGKNNFWRSSQLFVWHDSIHLLESIRKTEDLILYVMCYYSLLSFLRRMAKQVMLVSYIR